MSAPLVEKGYTKVDSGWWGFLEIEETPELRWPSSIEVYDRMRRQDAQVISVLRAVTLPVRRTTWRIDPAGAKASVTKLVAEDLGLPIQGAKPLRTLRTRDRFSWSDHLRLALLMLPFGHSVFEQTYRVTNGQQRLRKLGWRPPRTIAAFGVADDGGLQYVQQHKLPGATGTEGPKIPVDQLVAYVNDREGGNWLGQSLLRPAYKSWLLKDRALRTQAQTLDRNGLGVPYYEASEIPAGLTDQDAIRQRQEAEVARGLEMASAYRGGQNSGAAGPHGAKLSLLGVQGTLPDADKSIRLHDEHIARAVLANFLNLGGDNSTGSYALGSEFVDFFVASLQTVAEAIADVTNQHVIEDLVDINFGPDEPAPRLVFDEIGASHPATADSIQKLIQCRAITADDDLERHLRTTYNLPAPDPDTARTAPAAEPASTSTPVVDPSTPASPQPPASRGDAA